MSVFDQLRHSLPSIEQIGAQIARLAPRVLAALGVFVLGWLAAKGLRAATRALVARLGRVLLARRAPTAVRTDFLEGRGAEILGTAVFWGSLFVAAMFATETLGLPVVTTWFVTVSAYMPKILLGVTIILASIVAGRMVESIANRAAESLGARGAGNVARMARAALLALGLLVALQQVGVDVSFVTSAFYITLGGAVLGAALAFGLGSHAVVSNILAMHYVRRSLRVGDRVRVGEAEGKLVRATPVGVVLETDDGEINVPARELLERISHRAPPEGSP